MGERPLDTRLYPQPSPEGLEAVPGELTDGQIKQLGFDSLAELSSDGTPTVSIETLAGLVPGSNGVVRRSRGPSRSKAKKSATVRDSLTQSTLDELFTTPLDQELDGKSR